MELFIESLLKKSLDVTVARHAKTITVSHMKHTIMQEIRFDFLRELVKNIPDLSVSDDDGNDDSSETPNDPTAVHKPNTNLYSDTPQDQPINLSTNKASTSRSHMNGSINCSSSSSSSSTSNSQSPTTPPAGISSASLSANCLPSTSAAASSFSSPSTSKNSVNHSTPTFSPNTEEARRELKRQWDSVKEQRGQLFNNMSMSNTSPELAPKLSTTTNQRTRGKTRGGGNAASSSSRIVPAPPLTPTLRVDFDKEPIINLDFTNTNLHDKFNLPSTSASCTWSNQRGPSTSGSSPIVNIDVSKFAASASPNNHNSTATSSIHTSYKNSVIDQLDEDYDNI